MLALTLIFVLSLSQVSAQESAPHKAESNVPTHEMDYRMGPADVLSIGILNVKEFGRSSDGFIARVSNSGKIRIPYLGVLSVANMTPSELESEIARRFREKDLVKQPQVVVRVIDYRANNVWILGEVMMPGQYVLRDEMYVADLISLGKGFNEVASSVIYLYRRSSPARSSDDKTESNPTTTLGEAIKINYTELSGGQRPDLNFKLQAGDILYCPQQQKESYYVIGDVLKPGAVQFPIDTKFLASQAIALAGGPSPTAKMSKGFLLRYDEKGARSELPMDFAAIMKGKKPDFEVMPNDIIFIPGSHAKTLGHGLLNILPSIATVALY